RTDRGPRSMANEIKLPELGENLEGGEVLDVKVAAGDTVSEGQTLLEVEAEKGTVDVPAPMAGRVSKVLVKKGDQIKVGQTYCLMESADGAKEPAAKAAEPEPAPSPRREPSQKKEEPAAKEEKPSPPSPVKPSAVPKGDGRPETKQPQAPPAPAKVAAEMA